MWFASFSLLVALAIWQAWRRGPHFAVGFTAFGALLVPAWCQGELWGQPLDIRVATGIAALSIYCLHPRAIFRTPLGFVDYAAIAMVVVHLLSDWNNGDPAWLVPIRAYGEWAVPFLLGRLALPNWSHVRALLPVALAVVFVMAACAAIESATQSNPYESLFGIRTNDAASRLVERWGIRRASGPTHNPIYFGTLQLLLFPWAIYAAAVAVRREGPRFWLVFPLISLLGIGFTISRAPIFAVLPLLYGTVTVMSTRWRMPLISTAFIAAVVLGFNYQSGLRLLHHSADDPLVAQPDTIRINDQEVQYTGTLHRYYLYQLYKPAMKRAGLLGFGTERTSTFPPQVPFGGADAKALKLLWSIDNTYILIVLRFGFLGLIALVVLGLGGVIEFARLAQGEGLRRGIWAAGMSGALVATLLVMITVWMPHDYGFWFIWTLGAAAGLRARMLPDERVKADSR